MFFFYSPSLFVYNTSKKILSIEASFFSIFKRIFKFVIYLLTFLFFFNFLICIFYLLIVILFFYFFIIVIPVYKEDKN